MCCHTEIEAVDQTFFLIQSQYINRVTTGVPILKSPVYLNLEKSPQHKRESNPRSAALKGEKV